MPTWVSVLERISEDVSGIYRTAARLAVAGSVMPAGER
jgi:hypothetical protein